MPQVGKSENSDYRARLQLFKNYADEIWGGKGEAPLDKPMSDSSVMAPLKANRGIEAPRFPGAD